LCFTIARQLGCAAGTRLGLNSIDPAIAIRVRPILHAASGPAQCFCDVDSFFAAQRHQNRAVAIASKCIAFRIRSPVEFVDVP
jgi:hypothetical protein